VSYDPSQTRDEEGQWTEAGARKRAVKKLAKKLPRTPTAPTTAEHVTAKGKVVLTYKMVGRTPTVEAHLGDRLVARGALRAAERAIRARLAAAGSPRSPRPRPTRRAARYNPLSLGSF